MIREEAYIVVTARTRLKYIGGPRAEYNDDVKR